MDIGLLNGIGRQPVNAMRPAGTDVRDDPRFEALQQEIGKLANPAAEGQTDWARVAQLASLLLADKGKDLLTAGYLSAALLHSDGLPGLAVGLQVVGDLIDHFWADMSPPLARLRARRNALQWLLERAALSAEEQQWAEMAPQPSALVAELLGAARRIDEALRAKDEEAPSMRPLLALIDRVPVAQDVPVAASADTADVQEAALASRAPGAASAPAALPVRPALVAGDADLSMARALDDLNRVADALMTADPLDARAYRASRFANWAGIDALPPAQAGRTAIATPIAQIAQALQRMQDEAAQPQDAIGFCEAQYPAFPFWLDLQALCADSLARLGEPAQAARAEVERATRDLLQRLPGLESLAFASGMPFANARTLEWIGTLAMPAGTATTGAAQTSKDDLGATVAQARSLAANGELEAAVSLLQQAMARAPDAPTRLRAQIRLCELLSQHREARVPVPFAQLIVEQIRHHDLDRWDPALAVEGWVAAHSVLSQDDAHATEREAALHAIARLDAVRVLALS